MGNNSEANFDNVASDAKCIEMLNENVVENLDFDCVFSSIAKRWGMMPLMMTVYVYGGHAVF